ncbi:MAG: hypothetical protein KKC51_02860 [Verrucomicrobia bacterium]|nr:hypothetical protein [Verrucomicrobiota bacterium]
MRRIDIGICFACVLVGAAAIGAGSGAATWLRHPLPDDASILFLSNKGTQSDGKGRYRKEIYATDIEGKQIVRLTDSDAHHYLFGVDSRGRRLVTTCAREDPARPEGLGDEDERSLWVVDLQTGEPTRVSPPGKSAEGGWPLGTEAPSRFWLAPPTPLT